MDLIDIHQELRAVRARGRWLHRGRRGPWSCSGKRWAQILLTPVSVDELGNNLRKRLESSDADAKKQKFPG
jgi:hypothetical protein